MSFSLELAEIVEESSHNFDLQENYYLQDKVYIFSIWLENKECNIFFKLSGQQ